MILGAEHARFGVLRTARQRAEARELLTDLGFEASPDEPAAFLRPADLQLIEIAKSLYAKA